MVERRSGMVIQRGHHHRAAVQILQGDHTTAGRSDIVTAINHLRCAHHLEPMLVELFQGVDIPCIGEHFTGAIARKLPRCAIAPAPDPNRQPCHHRPLVPTPIPTF